jgi:predicted RNA-binding protein with PIN domain
MIPLEAIPEGLIGPIVEVAAAVLKAYDATAVPLNLRPLLALERRGLASGPGRRHLLLAIAKEATFRAAIVATFEHLDEAKAAVDGVTAANALQRAEVAADRDDLDLFACALWALDPDSADFALGCAAAVYAARARSDAAAGASQGLQRQLEEAGRTQQRAEARRIEIEAKLARSVGELRDERADRRRRDEQAAAREAAAGRVAAAAEAQLAEERVRALALEERVAREGTRVKQLETQLGEARERLAALAASPTTGSGEELAALAESAAQLASRLRTVQQRAAQPPAVLKRVTTGPAVGGSVRPAAPQRRVRPALPGGLIADTAEGAAAMLSDEGVVFVVDGYNVSHQAWPDAGLPEQREHLGRALHEVHLRYGCEIVCCFDGDGTQLVRPLRRPGLRVLFSAAGQEADELVVDAVQSLPKRIPALVASSDGWVREHAEAAGAVVISAATTARLFQRPGRR